MSPELRTSGQKRLLRNMLLLAGAFAVWWLVDQVQIEKTVNETRSLALAYASLLYLTITLCIGPVNLWLARINPLSSHLRRDFGIWAGVLGIGHVVFGLQVHFGGDWAQYFLHRSANGSLQLQADWFRLSNYAGMIATMIIVVLLFHSRDSSLRKLGASRWKSRQRLSYLLVLLLMLHGVIYQALEHRSFYGMLLLAGCLTIMALVQFSGWKMQRHRIPTKSTLRLR